MSPEHTICPQCKTYRVNKKSKHQLCIKCGYEVARLIAKKKREEAKKNEVLPDRECISCHNMFTPKYKDHKFCGIECQRTLPNKIKNLSWMEKKRKVMKSKDQVNLRIKKRSSKFNQFDKKIGE